MTTTTTQNKSKHAILTFIRIFVGVLFIFSGLVKANDPYGLAYKMSEFFEVWKMTGLIKASLVFSITIITFEILAGVAMIIGYAYRTVSLLILLLTIFFTFLTGYAVFSGKIKECGCFGDCIPLQAHQSFIKDLILLVLVFVLYFYRNSINPFFKHKVGSIVIIASLLATLGFQAYTLQFLPVVDCLAYKKGNNIWQEMQVPEGAKEDRYESILIYEKDGKRLEFTMDEFQANEALWNDTTLKYIDTKTELVEKGNATPKITDFSVRDFAGENYTEALLKDDNYNYLMFLKDADKYKGNAAELQAFINECYEKGYGFYILSANDEAATNKFKKKFGIDADAYAIDGTVCKTALRSNGGLMLIKGGTVLGKWSRTNYPKNPDEGIQQKK